jgi:hypothetical protein
MDHRRARSGRTDDEFRVALFVQFYKTFGYASRFRPIAGIKSGLTAARLSLIKFDLTTCPAQNLNCGSADAAPHLIDNAGYKQTDLYAIADCRLPIAD